MVTVGLRTFNGHYLEAGDSCTNYRISATPDGAGPREVFAVIPSDGRVTDSIRSGDRVHLQTSHGRYVKALDGGGGAVTGDATVPSIWETFTVEKLAGAGEIVQGDRVTFRAYNGRNYLMALDGGGGNVTADSLNRREWETFAVEFWNSIPVHLRSHDAHYLAAEDGGGREITATRAVADIWETFVLVNRTRKSGLHDGDAVCLQVWDGRFVAAEGGGGGNLTADRQLARTWETFTITKPGGGEISSSDRVLFRTNGVNYVMAANGGNGIVHANSRNTREWETFQLRRIKRSIAAVYGGFRALLGALSGPEVALSGGRGRYQLCANGIIIEDPAWGAFELHGENYRKVRWPQCCQARTAAFLDEQLRILGYPRSDVREHEGQSNYFERGFIFFRPDPDPVSAVVAGEFYEAWRRSAALGYPRLDRLPMSDGRGTYQTFDYGTVYHTATTCAHAIYGEVWRVWSNWIRGWNHDPDRSPREAFPDPLYSVPVVLSANPALGYPIGEEHDAPGGGRVQEFEFGSIASRATDTPRLKCIAQNMALLAYRMLSRHRTRPCDSSADRSRPGQSVRCGWLVRMFRGWRTGKNWERPPRYLPAPFSGRSRQGDLESDGGLLLMSRHPILDRHQTIYRQTVGADSFANKGVLHARIEIAGLANGYDVFLSHTQNPDESGGVAALRQQWAHMSAFIRAYSSPERPRYCWAT